MIVNEFKALPPVATKDTGSANVTVLASLKAETTVARVCPETMVLPPPPEKVTVTDEPEGRPLPSTRTPLIRSSLQAICPVLMLLITSTLPVMVAEAPVATVPLIVRSAALSSRSVQIRGKSQSE